MKKNLTEKEKLFCVFYAQGGDARGAAAAAGYSLSPGRTGIKLLSRKDISEEIERLEKRKTGISSCVEKGLRRLAFGSVADAVKLMLCDGEMSPQEIEKLDLFNVSDIKKPKGGGVEIKFFDRLKALERLSSMSSDEDGGESSFVKALSQGARLLSGEDDENA